MTDDQAKRITEQLIFIANNLAAIEKRLAEISANMGR